ncbi:MAG: VanW family protein [Candidatus Peribacteraceae bacterium]
MRRIPSTIIGLSVAAVIFFVPAAAFASPASITYTYKHHIFEVSVLRHPEWRSRERVWYYGGKRAIPPARFLSSGKGAISEPDWTFADRITWNERAIAQTISADIASKLDRPAGSVVIRRSASGTIVFEGQGLPGRQADIDLAAALTKTALEKYVSAVVLPVIERDPVITVEDRSLKEAGIREVVTVGESVFAKSPENRRHNIGVGVRRFNGHLIPKDSVFSFNDVLGPVNEKTGYRKELVIQGATTLPDYGGGLCQVSTTAFRGPWEYGLPILQRKNHSYAVSYYSPQGTDATIFPPNTDLKFRNDTPGALLIQSFVDSTDHAYFIYYGTADERKTEIVGPYITDRVAAPKEERLTYTTTIPVGEKRKAGEQHDGMKAVWYRRVERAGTGVILERMFSAYEARPLTYQLGVTPEDMARLTAGEASATPSWLPSKP